MKNKVLKTLKRKEPELIGMSLRVPEPLKNDIDKLAKDNNLSSNALIIGILDNFFNSANSRHEEKILTYLKAFRNDIRKEIKTMLEEGLNNDDEFIEIYNALLERNADLTQLIEELK